MTSDEVAWAHEGVLWNIGARFIDAHLDDFEATVVDAITEVTRHVDADSAGVWRVDRTTLQCVRQNRWVRQEGLDLGEEAPVTIDREFASRFMEGDGTAIVPLEQVLGAEIVVDRGWTGGSAGLCLVDQSADSITILVLAGLAVQWGEREIDLMRGFATLLRQFAGRVRAERTLGYRLKLKVWKRLL